jgi:hypothetical protein
MTKATELDAALQARLSGISRAAGYLTDVSKVYGPLDKIKDRDPTPYIQYRMVRDGRADTVGRQALRRREYAIEVTFSKGASAAELDGAHVDVLRALGFHEPDVDKRFPGLDDEEDEAEPQYPVDGVTTMRLTISIAVLYTQTY